MRSIARITCDLNTEYSPSPDDTSAISKLLLSICILSALLAASCSKAPKPEPLTEADALRFLMESGRAVRNHQAGQTVPCGTCQGTGRGMTCQRCGGRGTVNTPSGFTMACNACGGSGRGPCAVCQGSGTISYSPPNSPNGIFVDQ